MNDEAARKRAMNAKTARAYLIEHPGCTTEELRRDTGLSGHYLMWLSKLRLARFEGGGKAGPARWYVSSAGFSEPPPDENPHIDKDTEHTPTKESNVHDV